MLNECRRVSLLLIGALLLISQVFFPIITPVHAGNMSAEQHKLFEAGVLYHDLCVESKTSSSSASGDTSGNYSRLKQAALDWGQFAMDMQREYGTPWEVVFAQMQQESSMGTAGVAVNIENAGGWNWLGIRAHGGLPSVNGFAVFPSAEDGIRAWAGPSVARNGYYDRAFPYLDPNSYDLHNFLISFINVYAPASDGNTPDSYVATVESLINGPIAEVRAEKGWPSSEELAKKENIPVGGRHPIGSDVPRADVNDAATAAECVSGSNGDFMDDATWIYYNQYNKALNRNGGDYDESDLYDGKGNDHTVGCITYSTTMIIANMLGDNSVTPQTVFNDSGRAWFGFYVPNAKSFITSNYNLKTTWIDVDQISSYLQKGALVMGHVMGKWTDPENGLSIFDAKSKDTNEGEYNPNGNGHLYVIRGETSDGKWKISDPAYPERNDVLWLPETIKAANLGSGPDDRLFVIERN